MADEAPPGAERVRAAEVVAALCLGTDLGMGFPFEHGLQTTAVAMRLCERMGVDGPMASQTFYACLLTHSGCTTDAQMNAETFGGSLTTHLIPAVFGSQRQVLAGVVRALPEPGARGPARAAQVVWGLPRAARRRGPHLTAICEVAGALSERLGLPAEVRDLFPYLTDRWDGRGPLRRGGGEALPPPIRIVHVARDAAVQRMLGGRDHAVRVVGGRAGRALDPGVVSCLQTHADEVLALGGAGSSWDEVLDSEPSPRLELEGGAIDRALSGFGDFADLVSPHLAGHSSGVAALAGAAAARLDMPPAEVAAVRRAGLVHDLGRVAVHPRVWEKASGLSPDEWEQVRLHAYHTERVLARSPFLSALAPIAGAHHERLDGSGYHRGSSAAEIGLGGRLLAAADAFRALTEVRAHRAALAPEAAAAAIAGDANAGRLDPDAAAAVVEAAGHRAPRLGRPAGLSDREAEVVGLVARGLQTKQIGRALGISAKTADRHIQNAYRKIGVSTRAAATLFAMEHGLVPWGELPIARAPGRS